VCDSVEHTWSKHACGHRGYDVACMKGTGASLLCVLKAANDFTKLGFVNQTELTGQKGPLAWCLLLTLTGIRGLHPILEGYISFDVRYKYVGYPRGIHTACMGDMGIANVFVLHVTCACTI
jgi:hypothetical protein